MDLEFKKFYHTLKEMDLRIKIMVNFGYPECLKRLISKDSSHRKIVDIATFTITSKKLRKFPEHRESKIAVYEYPAREKISFRGPGSSNRS